LLDSLLQEMKFTHICLVCVAVLATGEEHNHSELEGGNSTAKLHGDHDHVGHDHEHGDSHAGHDHKEHDQSKDLHTGHESHSHHGDSHVDHDHKDHDRHQDLHPDHDSHHGDSHVDDDDQEYDENGESQYLHDDDYSQHNNSKVHHDDNENDQSQDLHPGHDNHSHHVDSHIEHDHKVHDHDSHHGDTHVDDDFLEHEQSEDHHHDHDSHHNDSHDHNKHDQSQDSKPGPASHSQHDHLDHEQKDHDHHQDLHHQHNNSDVYHDHNEHGHDHDHDHEHDSHFDPHQKLLNSPKNAIQDHWTWIAALGSILVISLCGVFGVLVIPLMQKTYYQHLIQLLIALAIGTLTGDALLHLLPHAVITAMAKGHDNHEHHDHEQHSQAVWLGFVATVSIIGFFMFEKCINILGEMREKNRQRHSSLESNKKLKVVREGHVTTDMAMGEMHCKNKYSNFCAKDLEEGEKPIEHKPNGTTHDADDHGTVIISQHEVVHHGHSHAHSHLHSAPTNISSVAWMVIFGDGVHNLADGLAIGTAFVTGYTSGLSTSVAVLCHELPHEIGDFAMLLKTGMTFKQAVFYNFVSSFLALIGLVIGLFLGTINNFSPWMFAAIAGIFLYVALVDMMPELSSGHTHPISEGKMQEGHWLEVLPQVVGMSIGVGIMLVIALYEHDLKEIFV